jgi:DNA repair photolyase
MQIKEIQCKSMLTKSKLPKINYGINPYVGCSHGCKYCYAKFIRRFTGHSNDEWGKFVDVRINAPEILDKELTKNPKKGIALLSTVTDPYQLIEKKYKLTRKLLKVLLKHDFPISILTKSKLVTRDIDLLKQFSECEVGLTITNFNQQISKDFEPTASFPQERLKALEELYNKGIKTYAFIGPIIPELVDLAVIFKELKGKVNYIMAESLNTKCGNCETLRTVFSEKYPHVYNIEFKKDYWDDIEVKLNQLSKKYNIKLKGFFRH